MTKLDQVNREDLLLCILVMILIFLLA